MEHWEKKLAVAQQSMERSLLNITKRDKTRNEIIRSETGVTEWRRFLLAFHRLDLVKQIFNDQTSKVQLFTEFITGILYVHDVSSL